ncbi:MAG: glycosyltransferase family 4 protein [Candidatus Binataceae bacterium]
MPKKPRRLLTIAHSYVVALNRRLAHELARAGGGDWEVTAVAPSFFHGDLRPIELERHAGEACHLEPVHAFMTRHIHCFVYGPRLRAILRQSWNLVHCWEEPYILAGGQIAWWTPRRTPYVFWTGQTLLKPYPPPFSMIERYCLERCSGWMARGELGVAAMLRRGYGCRPHRVFPLGVDTSRFCPDAAARGEVREWLGWTDSTPVVGFAGRFVEEKGLALLMRVLDRVRAPWRMLFLGGGPMEADIRAWAARYDDRVRIVKVIHDEVPRYLNAIDLLCAPSQTTARWREIFGRMLIEAFASRVAVIASSSGEIPNVVKDAGVIVGEQDEDGWVCELERMLDDSRARMEIARRGFERAHAVYAWPVVARHHLEFFAELLERAAA